MNPIANALTQGFSHENVLQYLLRHFPHARRQIEQALAKGFSADKIVKFLQGGRQEVNHPMTEHEQTRASHKQKQKDLEKNIGRGALAIGAAGLGAYALNGAIPQALQGEILPALPEGPLQIGMQQAPHQITQQQKQLPFIQGQEETITPPTPTVSAVQSQAPIAQPAPQVIPFPKDFEEMTKNMLKTGNDADQIAGAFKHFYPDMVKKYEKATNTPIRSAIEEFAKSLPEKEQAQPMGTGIKEAQPPIPGKIYEHSPILEEQQPIETKVPEPIQPIEEKQKEAKKGSKVALPNGDIGEITNIRQGIATVNADGKEYRRKLDELIESPLPEKDLAELHDDLMKGIESETGQEISRMVSFAGYDPKTNELAFLPHMGALYVYDDISPDDAKELTSVLSQRKTSGENFIGAWGQGTQSPIGAAMSKLIQKLQKERGGKGSEYKGKYEKIYDAIEPAKIASKEKHEEKKKAESAEKKAVKQAEKEKTKKEKENDKKRKAKKPRPN